MKTPFYFWDMEGAGKIGTVEHPASRISEPKLNS
jgi:hypothetical protein